MTVAYRTGHWRPVAELSEEQADARRAWSTAEGPARLAADRVWIIDPLDGTREFSESGRTDWAVHVAQGLRGRRGRRVRPRRGSVRVGLGGAGRRRPRRRDARLLDGSPLRYNRSDPRLPDLLVCRPELADRLLGAIARTDVEMPASSSFGRTVQAFG